MINIAQIGGGGGQPSQDTHGGVLQLLYFGRSHWCGAEQCQPAFMGVYSCPLAALKDPLDQQE